MRLTIASAEYAVAVIPKLRARRVNIRAGPVTLTVSPTEAVALADAIVDAAERIDNRPIATTFTKENTRDAPMPR